MEERIELDHGRYTVTHTNGTNFKALRYGEEWRDLTGDNLVFAMFCGIKRLEELLKQVSEG